MYAFCLWALMCTLMGSIILAIRLASIHHVHTLTSCSRHPFPSRLPLHAKLKGLPINWLARATKLHVRRPPMDARLSLLSVHTINQGVEAVGRGPGRTHLSLYLLLWSFPLERGESSATPTAWWPPVFPWRSVIVFVFGVVLTKFGCLSSGVVVVHRYRPLDGILLAI